MEVFRMESTLLGMAVPISRRLTLRSLVAVAATLVLAAGAAPAVAEGGALAEAPAVRDAVALLSLWVEEQRAWQDVPGVAVAVVHDQELVWAAGFGMADRATGRPFTPETPFRIGSVSKLFTSTVILQLRDEGTLALDDPLVKWVPEFAAVSNPFPGSPQVTLRHLLTQTSGLTREPPMPVWTTHEFPTREELLAALGDGRLIRHPGEVYKYSNFGMGLLGIVIENATGQSWADAVRTRIFEPLGMDDSTGAPGPEALARRVASYYRRELDGSRKTFDYYDMKGLASAGNIVSTVLDLAELAKLQFRDGPAGGSQVLAGSTLREMHRAQFVYPSFSGGRGLGFGVSRSDGTTIVSHGGWIGGNRTHLLLDPAKKLAVIAATNADDASPYFFSSTVHDVVAPALAKAVSGAAPPAPDPAWERWLGTYTDPWEWEYEVMIQGGGLVFYEHNYPPEENPLGGITRLEPQADGTFLMGDGEPVVFETAEDGSVTRIRRRYEYLTPVER